MLELNTKSLTLSLTPQHRSAFHYLWLRDNCQCADCLHPDTGERILVTADIDADIKPDHAEFDGQQLLITWQGSKHQSRYSRQWLLDHDYSAGQFNHDLATGQPIYWGAELQQTLPAFEYDALYQDDTALLDWCCALRDYGLTVIRGAPQKHAEIERFANHVAIVRETIYDRLHDVRATPHEYNAYNVASTTLELKPHTDMPSYNNPPGVQMFHFMKNESSGGESTAVDGFHVARELKRLEPQAYKVLAATPVHFKLFSSRGDIESYNPLLSHDVQGNLQVVRFSNQLLQPACLSVDKMDEFYRAYQTFARLLEAPDYKIQFKLNTGDIMVTNNLRVLHGRNAYDANSGERHLQLTYMDFDDVLSRIRMLRKAA